MVIATLNGLLGSWYSFMQRMYARRKWLLSAHLIRREEERWEQLKIKLSPFKEDPSSDEEYENSILEEPIIHLIIWIRNNDVINEEDDEVEGSRRSLPKKQIKDKYSIAISWYCFVMNLIVFSWCVMHDRLFTLILLICMWWVSSSWQYTTLQCYLSKPLWWHIGLVHNLNDVMVEIEGIYKVFVKYGWMLYWLNSCMMHKNLSLCICFMK